jgi:hypothetical protein
VKAQDIDLDIREEPGGINTVGAALLVFVDELIARTRRSVGGVGLPAGQAQQVAQMPLGNLGARTNIYHPKLEGAARPNVELAP